MFIEYERAKSRVVRNFEEAERREDESRKADNQIALYCAEARCAAIIQTWAEVTNQRWNDARIELQEAVKANV